MTEATHSNRPDVDIEEDIDDIIAHYPPLQADRHHLEIAARDGVVFLSGHVRSAISRRFLIERVAQVRGVYSVNGDSLYDEETIRLDAGPRIPSGVIANVNYGTVILTGMLPSGMTEDEIARMVAQVPGVVRVVTKF